jgi:hypothetical protein
MAFNGVIDPLPVIILTLTLFILDLHLNTFE